MSWKIDYTPEAARAIRKLDPQVRKRVRHAVEQLQVEPLRGKPLQFQLKGYRSWRTGDFRIVYSVQDQILRILIVTVGHRRDVYQKLKNKFRG